MEIKKRQYEATENRQAQLLESAAQLIAVNGLSATTMPNIAKNAGLSVGGLYRHFKSKSDLVTALIRDDAEIMAARLASIEQEPIGVTTLEAWAMEQFTSLSETSSFVLRLEILALAAREPAVGLAAQTHDAQLNLQLHRLIKRVSHPSSLGQRNIELAIELMCSLIDGIAARSAVAGELTPNAKELIRQTIVTIISPSAT